MPNKNYRAGRRAEWRAREMLTAAGYHTVIRAAGSKGPVDLVALGSSNIAFVQVKRGRGTISRREHAKLFALNARLPSSCTVEIWRFAVRGRLPEVEIL